MSKVRAVDRAAFDALDALYRELPTVACRGLCAVACSAIPLTDLEARRLQLTTHQKPRTTPAPVEKCIYLTPSERCSAYAVRPLICRVWGVVRALSCMHGCVPDRWLSEVDFLRIARAIEQIGGGRVLRTDARGLTCVEGESFSDIPDVGRRSPRRIEADAERTRALRALHGGRIIAAVTHDDEP